jgi:phage host-nuclease inhibitor protein Gam
MISDKTYSARVADILRRLHDTDLGDEVREIVAYYEAQISASRAEIVHLREEINILRSGETDRRLKQILIAGEK